MVAFLIIFYSKSSGRSLALSAITVGLVADSRGYLAGSKEGKISPILSTKNLILNYPLFLYQPRRLHITDEASEAVPWLRLR